MDENPKFPKIITRPSQESPAIKISEITGNVKYTGEWENVKGGKDVMARTWILDGVDSNVDGADIIIAAGGHTPVQLVSSAEIVVDTPEGGNGYCLVLDTNGSIHINSFNSTSKFQMVFTQGMIVCWVAMSEIKLTEFESPSFSDEMFTTVPEHGQKALQPPLRDYLKILSNLRQQAQITSQLNQKTNS